MRKDTFTIPLPEKLPADICTEIAKRSCYCDDRIVETSYRLSDNPLVVVASDDGISEVLTGKIDQLVEKMKSDRLVIKPKNFERGPEALPSLIPPSLKNWRIGEMSFWRMWELSAGAVSF